jgi:hypothetical protein
MWQRQAKRLFGATDKCLHMIPACGEVVSGVAMHDEATVTIELDGQ